MPSLIFLVLFLFSFWMESEKKKDCGDWCEKSPSFMHKISALHLRLYVYVHNILSVCMLCAVMHVGMHCKG